MQPKRDELVINLPQYYLVVRPGQDRITFLAYNATHQLSIFLTRQELSTIKWLDEDLFDPLEFYQYLKQHPHHLAIDWESN
jgi:hypothetical protein